MIRVEYVFIKFDLISLIAAPWRGEAKQNVTERNHLIHGDSPFKKKKNFSTRDT